MRQKTQTDRTRPTLCHAGTRPLPTPAVDDAGQVVKPRAGGQRSADPWAGIHNFSGQGGSKDVGAAFEARALVFLQRQRLRFVARNVVCRGGEIDLVMRDRDGALVFVEVRARARRQFGGAAASIGWQKRQRLVRAAQHFLLTRTDVVPACRFDVIAFECGRLVWIRDAFRVDEV